MISMASSCFFSGNIAADIEAMIAPQKVSQGQVCPQWWQT